MVCMYLGAKFQCAETTQSNSCRKRFGPAGHLLTSRLVQARSPLLESGKAKHMCEAFRPKSKCTPTWVWSSGAKISSRAIPSGDREGMLSGDEQILVPPSSPLDPREDSRKVSKPLLS